MRFIQRLSIQFLLICISAHLHISASAQDSSRLRISLLTCTPGEELYSTFGHSALRVTDSNSVTDYVYNYGTFDFGEKDFYLKFIQGRLKYFLSAEPFYNFKNDYIADNRGITEQVLNFSAGEKISIYHALLENIKPENRFYLYDFFMDNCTTRLRDIIVKNHEPVPALPAVMPVDHTFRDALHQYMQGSGMAWDRFGIDLLLGASGDAVMSAAQQEFLPDNLMHALDSSKNTVIVASSKNLFITEPVKKEKIFFTPFMVFGCIFLLYILLCLFKKNKPVKNILQALDSLLFFTIGVVGIILLSVWLITDYPMLKNNYNLLWAWPTHIIYAFLMHRDSKRVRAFSLFMAVFLVLLLISWAFLAQRMDLALIPVVLLMIFRAGSKIFGTRMTRDDTDKK